MQVKLRPHSGMQRQTAFEALPDGRLVSGGLTGRLALWNTARPASRPAEVRAHEGPVTALAALPDGRRLVSGGRDGFVRVWDLGKVFAGTSEVDNRVLSVAPLRDGRLVSGGWDGRVLIHDLRQNPDTPVPLGRLDNDVQALGVLPNGHVIAGNDNNWAIWNPTTPGREVARTESAFPISELLVLRDGRILSSGRDDIVRIWEARRPKGDSLGITFHTGLPVWPPYSLANIGQLKDGSIASASPTDKGIIVRDINALEQRAAVLCPDQRITSFTAMRDGRMAVGDVGGTVYIAETSTKKPSELMKIGRHFEYVTAIAQLSDGRLISGGADDRLMLSDLEYREMYCILHVSVSRILAVPATPTSDYVVVVHRDGALTVLLSSHP